VVAKLAIQFGAQVFSGLFGGSATYLTSAAIRGEKIDFKECLKSVALGAVTSSIMFFGTIGLDKIAGKINGKMLTKLLSVTGKLFLGSGVSVTGYLLGCAITGEPISVEGLIAAASLGAATTAITMIGTKIVKNIKVARAQKKEIENVRKRIKYNLPSDKNKNSYIATDPDAPIDQRLSKEDFMKDPYKKAYVITTDANGNKVALPIKNGYPQFDGKNVAVGSVRLKGGIVTDRQTNFDAMDDQLAKQWRNNPKSIPQEFKEFFKGKVDLNRISGSDIANARQGVSKGGLGYTWHESEDMHSGYLVKTSTHNKVAHAGGINRLETILGDYKANSELAKFKMYNALNELKGSKK